MSGYVVGGYVLTIGSLLSYGASLAYRGRAARRRVLAIAGKSATSPPFDPLVASVEPAATASAPLPEKP